jgi:hypothetical protein
MKYETILRGNYSDGKRIFTLQKKIVRIVVDVKTKTHRPV